MARMISVVHFRWIRSPLPVTLLAPHRHNGGLPGQQGPLPGAKVRKAREPSDHDRVHPPPPTKNSSREYGDFTAKDLVQFGNLFKEGTN